MALSKEDLYKTPGVHWSEEDDAFVASHPNYPNIHGVGDTEQEAIEVFYKHLEVWNKHSQKNKIHNKGGRPRKNNVVLNINISKEAKLFLDYYCIQNDLKQGEQVDKLILDFKRSLS